MRTFVAIEVSDPQVIDSIKKFQSEVKINAKPVKSQNFHFTLQFLGEITDEMKEKVVVALQSVKFQNFAVTLEKIGAFPKPKFPRVIWVGTDEKGGKNLIELAKKVETVLKPLGLVSDKPFKPHITIFRIKKRKEDIRRKLEAVKETEFGIQKICTIKLKKSQLTPTGPIYSDLMEVEGTN